MKNKQGFSQSVAHLLPDGWDILPINSVCTLYNGRAYALHEWESTGIPVIRLQNLTGGSDYYYSNIDLPEQKYCNRGDLLYMWSATFGPYIWMGEKAIYHYHIWKVVPQEGKADKRFLFYKLYEITEEKKNRASNGGTMLHITKSSMEASLITLPPIHEQQAIAEALSDADALIEALEQLIAKKRLIKQGVMQELLTGRRRLAGFSGEWKSIELKTIVTQFIVPMRDKPKKFSGDIPWCRIEDFSGKYLYSSKSDQFVDDETIMLMKLKINPTGTLLVSCSADLGRCAIVCRPLITNQTFIGLEFDEKKASNEFFYYFMTFHAEDLNDLSAGTTISYLSREQFETFREEFHLMLLNSRLLLSS